MKMSQINLRANIDDYTNRVLGVIKEKYGLKDKGEALDKFAEMFGDEFIEHEVKEEVITEVLEIFEEHRKKHGLRTMTLEELDELTGIKDV